MRSTPRTWPSIRFNRAATDCFVASCILLPYPGGVYLPLPTPARNREPTMHRHDHHAAAMADRDPATDPVCGMTVDPATSRHRFEHGGDTFHFCCAGCRDKFAADPDRYLTPPDDPAADTAATYTCPMHPEVRQVGPGSCPICGMALEPLTVGAEAEANPELADMSRRLWIGAALDRPGCCAGDAPASRGSTRTGCSSSWPRRSCCGPGSRSSGAAGIRWFAAASTCSR